MLLAQANTTFDILALIAGWVVLIFIALLGGVIVWNMLTGTIDLTKLISEPNGDASMSRLQLLIFTFVIAVSLFLIIVYSHAFPATIPQGVLILLGISSSSYLVSKGIQFSSESGIAEGDPTVTIVPQRATIKAGSQPFTFQVKTAKLDDSAVKWTLPPTTTAPLGSIDENTGVYTPPAAPPPSCPYVEVHATSVANPSLLDVALIHII